MTVAPRTGPSATHEVVNQPPPLLDHNAFDADPALREAVAREGGEWGEDRLRDMGAVVASTEADDHRRRAQRNVPVLHTHDRFGHRIDEVEYDPSMHWMLRLGVEREVSSLPWRDPRPGAHVVRAGLFYLMNQLDTGPCCPIAINYAATPTLRRGDPALAAEWEPRLTLPDYDRFAQAGMVMTEKQGGSDLRANTTVAEPIGDGWYELTGHKWFCTHPVFDVFLTLAQAPGGIACFVAERPHPGFRIQRLKDKLGGRCLASSEVEYDHLPARILGEEGRGTAAMIEQILWTRLDALIGGAGMMRRLLAEAVHHARHRSAFSAPLVGQPAMTNVLADLAIESEAALLLALRLARAFDEDDRAFNRLALGVAKFWVSKRGAPFAAEALECHGGNGYVETQGSPVAQFYRDIQINTVWEGSGNVVALDVLRALARSPDAADAFLAELELARGADARLDAVLDRLPAALAQPDQWTARALVEDLAVAFQASLLLRHAPPAVAGAFCASRLAEQRRRSFGTLPRDVDGAAIVERALAL
ncbi:MAG TPA: acyl-CoA dehydrogenase family protein [Solirubrobacteraceae bacterium]|nr:acyl-CoA dehydrogenase family protein [Solirubrobacteraceae bacterium]